MHNATQRDMSRQLIGLAAFVVAIAAHIVPAQAHEWLWRHQALTYPYAQRDPSNPFAGPSTVRYRSVTREIQSYRPVDPLPWGDVNRGVAPAPKPPPKSEQEK